MGMNAIEKILANHSEQTVVRPGDVVMVDVDVTVQFDSARADVLKIANPDKLVLLHDHLVPAPTVAAANAAKRLREFVDRFDIEHYFPVGKHGISHVLVAQEGYALPGQILANADSHTCSSGALNCLARGMGGPEMLYILCKGQTWFLVGPDHQGRARRHVARAGVSPRHHPLHLPGTYGDFAGRNLEWYGDGLAGIGMDGRLTMATISAELSAEFSLFPYDGVLERVPRSPGEVAVRAGLPRRRRRVRPGHHGRPLRARAPDRAARSRWRGTPRGSGGGAENIRSTRRSSARAPTAGLATFAVAAEILKGTHDCPRDADDRHPRKSGHLEGGHPARLRRDADGRRCRRDQFYLRRVLRRSHGSAG